MKKLILVSALLASSGLCLAQQVGRVISATPIVGQVTVPHQVCHTEQVALQQPKSGAGALMGAIAGGAMGNAVGGGAGKAAATLIGLVGGAAVGDGLEGSARPQWQNVQRCSTQNSFENKPVAYNVVYEFAGKQYSVQMPNDPGPSVQLQVTPVGASAPTTSATVNYAQPVYQQPTYVVSEAPINYAYPSYYSQPNYVPVAALMGLGLWVGAQRHGYRHWR